MSRNGRRATTNGDTAAVVSGSASLTTAATAGSGVGAYAISPAQGSLRQI